MEFLAMLYTVLLVAICLMLALLLYRGSADVGKTHSVMPHRKWRMEFQTDQFPDYDRWMASRS